MDGIFQIKTQLLAPRPSGSTSPLVQQGRDGYAKQGWGGRLWGWVALQSLSLEGLLSDLTPPQPGLKGRVSEPGGPC